MINSVVRVMPTVGRFMLRSRGAALRWFAVVVSLAVAVGACGDAAVPVAGDSGWIRAPHKESVFGGPENQQMEAVAAGGPGLVAVGNEAGLLRAAVWTSTDGVAWTRVPQDEGSFFYRLMYDIAPGGPGFVAVGEDLRGGDSDAAVWTSPDGISWVLVPHNEATLGGPSDQAMWTVVPGGPGLVATGIDDSTGSLDLAVWTSQDGVAWIRVPDPAGAFSGPGDQSANQLIVGGPGLVAVGYDDSGGDRDAAVWTSTDGETWTRVTHHETVFGGPFQQGMAAVVAGDAGLIAVGYDGPDGDADAAAWTSSDGVTWTKAAGGLSGVPSHQEMHAIVLDRTVLVAVGIDDSGGDPDGLDMAVWTSSDGTTWIRVPHDPVVFGGTDWQWPDSLAISGLGLVVVGYDAVGGDEDAAVWVFTGE